MYNRTETILEAYPYVFTDIRKGRGAYICTDEQGKEMLLKQFKGSLHKAELLNDFLIFLKESGWKAEQIIATKEDQLLYHGLDDMDFYLRSWYDGRECDTRNRGELSETVSRLARFHRLTAQYQGDLPDTMRQEGLKSRYGRYTRELHKVYNFVRTRKRKNDFEAEFLKEYGHYLDQADRVMEELDQAMPETDEGLYGICHGDFNQHNVLFVKREAVFMNYEHICLDLYISDLANFFRKIMEKNNWRIGLGLELLESYDRVRPLKEGEWKQLYLRMAYPEKFRKVADHYANSKKNWANPRDYEKLQKIIVQEPARQDFLKKFYRQVSC